ncbi:hypothetical protein ACWEPC_05125 [Nonomuraea sp. NPDC004297]
MDCYGVDVNLYDRHGHAYRPFGMAEFDGNAAYDQAFRYAYKRVAMHRNASACILRNGDPYAWVSNDTTDYAGVARRNTDKPQVKYI